MNLDPSQPPSRIQASMVIRNIGQLVTIAQQHVPGATGPLQIIEHAAMADPYVRDKVMEGDSPKSVLYSSAKRPKFQNPYCVAISVTEI